YYNSFHELQDLAQPISAELQTVVIVVMAQSVSETYFVSVFRKGDHLRTLEWSGEVGAWVKQTGAPLPFETNPLGRNISEDREAPFFVFEREDVADYCKALGLVLWETDDDGSAWTEIRAVPATVKPPAKPRWKIW